MAALGAFALLSHFSGSDGPTAGVVTISRPVSAGSILGASDVALTSIPAALVPAGALTDPVDVVGRSAAVALTAHTVVQSALLVSGTAPMKGRSLVPITVHDAQLREILTPGLRIALVSSVGDVPGVVTDDAIVHMMPQVAASSIVSTGQSALILVEVPTALAPEVSILGQSGQLSLFLSG